VDEPESDDDDAEQGEAADHAAVTSLAGTEQRFTASE